MREAKFVAKVRTGTMHLLTFVLNSEVESAYNRAERALREHVVIWKTIAP